MTKLITPDKTYFEIWFKAYGIPHTPPGQEMGLVIQATNETAAAIQFKINRPHCEIVYCRPSKHDWGAHHPRNERKEDE